MLKFLFILLVSLPLLVTKAGAQDGHHHGWEGHHGIGHDYLHHWYQTLKQPNSGISCCNKQDCRPTEARMLPDGTIEAMKDGRWVTIPPEKILNVPSPDLNSHICAPDSTSRAYHPDHVFCFVFGAGV